MGHGGRKNVLRIAAGWTESESDACWVFLSCCGALSLLIHHEGLLHTNVIGPCLKLHSLDAGRHAEGQEVMNHTNKTERENTQKNMKPNMRPDKTQRSMNRLTRY